MEAQPEAKYFNAEDAENAEEDEEKDAVGRPCIAARRKSLHPSRLSPFPSSAALRVLCAAIWRNRAGLRGFFKPRI